MTDIRSFFSGKVTYGIGWFLLIIVTLYLVMVPYTQEPGAYETFYLAVDNFKHSLSPYANYGFDLYKYSPTFLFFPLYILSFLPMLWGAVLWQSFSLAIYYFGMFKLFQQFKVNSKTTALFSILLVFYALSDLIINGTHGQSNTLLVGFMVLALAFYFRRQFFGAALTLAFVTNMKIFPIALMLLLFLDLNKRFIGWSLVSHLLLFFVPIVIWGQSEAMILYSDWIKDLLIDEKYSFGKNVHYYLSIRPFLEANFGIIWGKSYFLFILANGLVVAIGVWLLKLKNGLSNPFTRTQLLLIFNLSMLFILVFNPRTEGPTLIVMAPVYAISLWWVFNHLTGVQKTKAMWLIFFIFMLVSQSTSDLFRGTFIQIYSWDHNLRTLGLLGFYLVHLYWLFKLPVKTEKVDENSYQITPNAQLYK